MVTLTATVTATDTFSLAAATEIYKISQDEENPIRIYYSIGSNYSDFTLVSPEKLKLYGDRSGYCAKVGDTLVFSQPFTADSLEFGGTIKVPAYTIPADFDSSNPDVDEVPTDDPEWLATRVAAEDIRTSLVRQNQYPNLIEVANELMKKMKQNNGSQKEFVTKEKAAIGKTW